MKAAAPAQWSVTVTLTWTVKSHVTVDYSNVFLWCSISETFLLTWGFFSIFEFRLIGISNFMIIFIQNNQRCYSWEKFTNCWALHKTRCDVKSLKHSLLWNDHHLTFETIITIVASIDCNSHAGSLCSSAVSVCVAIRNPSRWNETLQSSTVTAASVLIKFWIAEHFQGILADYLPANSNGSPPKRNCTICIIQ